VRLFTAYQHPGTGAVETERFFSVLDPDSTLLVYPDSDATLNPGQVTEFSSSKTFQDFPRKYIGNHRRL
jgi:hypothetical protein